MLHGQRKSSSEIIVQRIKEASCIDTSGPLGFLMTDRQTEVGDHTFQKEKTVN